MPRASVSGLVGTYGLLVLLVLLVLTFSLLKPDTFPTAFNARTLLATKSVVALAGLAVMIPLAAGQFDLSVGYMITLTHVLAVGLQVKEHIPWPAAVLIVLVIGVGIGLINGLLVVRAHIDAFIATLGVGTVLYGVAEWYTGGNQIAGNLAGGFTAMTGTAVGIPAPALYVLGVAIVLWLIFEHMPAGRFLYALGANARAAELVGIRSSRCVPVAFMASGGLAALAGVILGSQLGVGNSSIGSEFLLQAFAAALLGATSVRPGRVNVWGTVVAVLVLAVAVDGLQQLGASFYVEPLFNGSILVVAVGLAVYAARRQRQREAAA